MVTPENKWFLELGAYPDQDGIRFRVWAPKAKSVSLKLVDSKNTVPMEAEGKGYYSVLAEDLEPGARYFYLLDRSLLRPDPVSRSQPEGVHGPSEVINPEEFIWQDLSWPGIALEEFIIYEVHTGTFTPEGTFEAAIPFLTYLKEELGITVLELMPVAQFPGNRNWGYDGTYFYAPQNSYGGVPGLKALVNACHQKGLAVILDVVYNHSGPEGNYLSDFGPYFTTRYTTPWGPAINLDGPYSDDVRRFIIDNARHWITEYHLDGLRLDAVQGIFDFSARHLLDELREAVHRLSRMRGYPIVIIAESDLNDARIINPTRKGGYGLDAQWNDDFHHALHAFLTGEQNKYYLDFGELSQVVQALKEGFVFSGQYSAYRRRHHGNPSKHLPSTKFIVFSQNHDQVGNRLNGERLSTLVGYEILKLAAGLVLLSPNIPLLFMGEEYGETAPFLYFVSHADQALMEAVRQGRIKEIPSNDPAKIMPPDPGAESTFTRSKLDWGLLGKPNHRILQCYYRQLIHLRKHVLALSHLSQKAMKTNVGSEGSWLFLQQSIKDDQVFYILNFSESPLSVSLALDPGDWRKILDSSSTEWLGPGSPAPETLNASGAETSCPMGAQSLVLYRKRPIRGVAR